MILVQNHQQRLNGNENSIEYIVSSIEYIVSSIESRKKKKNTGNKFKIN